MIRRIDRENLERLFINNNKPPTQSHIWCPLIWNALFENSYDIPQKWCILRFNNQDFIRRFREIIDELSKDKKWIQYAIQILLN